MSDHFGNIPIQPSKPVHRPPKKTKAKIRSKHKVPSGKKVSPTPKRKKHNHLVKWLLFTVLVIVAYSGIGFLIVPYYLSDILPDQLKTKTGYTLKTTSVKFNPLTFKLTAGYVELRSDDSVQIASFQSLETEIALVPLLRFDLICDNLHINQLEALIIRKKNNRYNLEQLIPASANEEKSEIIGFSDLPFFFSLNNIVIKDSKVLFRDLPAGKEHSITDIHLNLPTLSNIKFQADRYIHPYFRAVINGSPFELTGQTRAGYGSLDTGVTELSCELKELDLKLYSEYLPFKLPFTIGSGKASGTIDLHFDPDRSKDDKLAINFNFALSSLFLKTKDNSLSGSSDKAHLKGSYQPVANNLLLREFVISEPLINLTKQGKNHKLESNTSDNKIPNSQNVAINPFSFMISSLSLFDGQLVVDSDQPKQHETWSKLQILFKNIHNQEYVTKSKVQTTGLFNISARSAQGNSRFFFEGEMSPNIDETTVLKGKLKLEKFPNENILNLIAQKKFSSVKGTGSLTGSLELFPDQFGAKWKSNFSNTDIRFEDFYIKSDNADITATIKAQIVELGPVSGGRQDGFKLGSVKVKNGSIILEENTTNASFPTLLPAKSQIKEVNYQGSVSIIRKRKGQKDQTLSDLTFTADQLDSKTRTNNLTTNGTFSSGATFHGQGNLKLSPFAFRLTTEFNKIPMETVHSYFNTTSAEKSNVLIDGTVSGNGVFTYPQKSYTGELQLDDGKFELSADNIMSIENITLSNFHYTSSPFHFGVEKCSINKPKFNWILPAEMSSFPVMTIGQRIKATLPQNLEKTAKKKISVSEIDIQKILFSEGIINITDKRLSPHWAAEITSLEGSISNIHSGKAVKDSQLSLRGMLDESPFRLEGEVGIFAEEATSNLSFSLSPFPLASFHKQLLDKVELETSSASFTVNGTIESTHTRLKQSGIINFSDISTLEKNSSTALAFALLSDPDERIKIAYDYVSDPKNIKPLFREVLSVMQRALVKGLVSPLLLAEGDYSDLIGVEVFDFIPGELVLTEGSLMHLERLSQLLKSHPFVGVELLGGVNTIKERSALHNILQTKENDRVKKLNDQRFTEFRNLEKDYQAKIATQQNRTNQSGKISETTIPAEILAGFQPTQPMDIVVDDGMLLDLAQRRLDYLEQYLMPLNSLQHKRVFIKPLQQLHPATPENPGEISFRLRAVDK